MKFSKKQMPRTQTSTFNVDVHKSAVNFTKNGGGVSITPNKQSSVCDILNLTLTRKDEISKPILIPSEPTDKDITALALDLSFQKEGSQVLTDDSCTQKTSTSTITRRSRIPVRSSNSQSNVNKNVSEVSSKPTIFDKEAGKGVRTVPSKIPLCAGLRQLSEKIDTIDRKSDADGNGSVISDSKSDADTDLTSWSSVYVNFQVTGNKSSRIKATIMILLQEIETTFNEYQKKYDEFKNIHEEFKEKWEENLKQMHRVLNDL